MPWVQLSVEGSFGRCIFSDRKGEMWAERTPYQVGGRRTDAHQVVGGMAMAMQEAGLG